MILAQSSSGGGSPMLILLLAMPVVLYLMMRSQRKKMRAQQDLQRTAGVGDEIMTTSGMFGTIVEEDEDEGTVIVEIAPGTHVKMVRAGIARRVTEDDEYDDDDQYDDEYEDDEDDVVEVPDEEPATPVSSDDNAEGPFRS